ncbi:hypothetical protein M378DRAFT_822990 [Amanita muscaria Koide BX008]|uniref:Uncharacterized protein n=1 Tax=Amanita muscaria (strain Koide BX008) TaxID=946122 RepID=A0A0C2TND5_AMAMK|nr:hypothetical protein M378DRAFT_822990 [Amanita muscaria Koide BX008]
MTEITFWSLSVVLSALLSYATCANAQEANCTDTSYGWAFNSLGLSPCRVAEQLASPCNINVSITQLPNISYAYFGPPAGEADPCRCSSVYYSLLAGCAACQDANWMRWNNYTQNCSTVYLTIFPSPIPSGTKVPHWAYLNVSIDGEFDPTEAAAGGRGRSFDA